MKSLITISESKRLSELENKIESGKKTFIEVGLSLAEIRDSKLYRAEHKTFEEYCHSKWGWNRAHCNQLISGASAVKSLPSGLDTMVSNQRQARELSKVEPEQREEVIRSAHSTATSEGRTMTARDVATAANPKSFCTACQTAYIKSEGHECKVDAQAEEEREMIRKAALQQQAKDAFRGIVLPQESSPRNNILAAVEAVVVCIPTLTTVADINAGLLALRVAVKKMEEHLKAVRMEGEA